MSHQTTNETHDEYRKQLGLEFGDVFYYSLNEWCDLWCTWSQYENLFGHGSERVALLNKAGAAFFYQVDRHFLEACMLSACRLSDPIETAGKKNLTVQLFAKFIDTAKRKAEMAQLLDAASASTGFARDWRNRRIAHNDFDLRNGTGKPLEDASRKLMNIAIDKLHKVFAYVATEFMNTHLADTVIAPLNNEVVMLHRLHLGVEQFERDMEALKAGKLELREWPKWLQGA
jgi:AbiU2